MTRFIAKKVATKNTFSEQVKMIFNNDYNGGINSGNDI